MAKQKKTSAAVYKTARLNPINPEDKRVMEIVSDLEGRGFNFKQIAVDAILRADGATPEMYPHDAALAANMQHMLEQFAREIMTELQKRPVGAVEADEENGDGEVSPFLKNFARSFSERQRKIDSGEE